MLGIHFNLIINSENVLTNKRNVSNEHTMSLLLLLSFFLFTAAVVVVIVEDVAGPLLFVVGHLILFSFDVTNRMQ